MPSVGRAGDAVGAAGCGVAGVMTVLHPQHTGAVTVLAPALSLPLSTSQRIDPAAVPVAPEDCSPLCHADRFTDGQQQAARRVGDPGRGGVRGTGRGSFVAIAVWAADLPPGVCAPGWGCAVAAPRSRRADAGCVDVDAAEQDAALSAWIAVRCPGPGARSSGGRHGREDRAVPAAGRAGGAPARGLRREHRCHARPDHGGWKGPMR